MASKRPKPLLDANVLLALAWPAHSAHSRAHRWFAGRHAHGWATCLLVQSGFARISSVAAYSADLPTLGVLKVLEKLTSHPGHEVWPMPGSLLDLDPGIRARIYGHQQINDALLLETAMRSGGTLATFDSGISALLPGDERYQRALELIPD